MYVTWLGPPNQTVYATGNSVHKSQNSSVRILGNAQENMHILQLVTIYETNEGLYKCIAIEGNKTFQLVIQSTYTFTMIHCIFITLVNAVTESNKSQIDAFFAIANSIDPLIK